MDQYEKFSIQTEANHRKAIARFYNGPLENYLRFLRIECFMSIDRIEKFLAKQYKFCISYPLLAKYLGEE